MKLHRLELTNFKGITHREIPFPDRGVVVVCGPNEIGKSSMVEALDLLLEVPATSRKENVRQIQPADADVATEVLAEISAGKYRFRYRKRFNKKPETTLTILEPVPENLTGEPAHQRVLAMLADTMDFGLWKAQRVLQSAPTAAVSLRGSDALSRALDLAAAGDSDALSGTESLLTGAIAAEFVKYFTPATGRAAKEWKDVQVALAAAEAEVRRYQTAIDEVDALVIRHAQFTGRHRELNGLVQAAGDRRVAAQNAADGLADVTRAWSNAGLAAESARNSASGSESRRDQRVQLADDAAARETAIVALREKLTATDEAETLAGIASGTAAATAGQSTAALVQAEERAKQARGIAEGAQARGKLAEVDAVQAELGRIADELAGIGLTSEAVAQIDAVAATVRRFTDQMSLSTGTVEFTPVADLMLLVDGESVMLTAGQPWRPDTSIPTTVELPGVLSMRIDPGATTADVQANLIEAQQQLDGLLAAAGVTDTGQAREIDQRRKDLTGHSRERTAQLTGLCGAEDPQALTQRLTALVAALPEVEGLDLDTARAEQAAAEEAVAPARAKTTAERQIAEAANTEFTEKATAAKVLRSNLRNAEIELATVREKLATQRAEADDDQVMTAALVDAEKLSQADVAVTELAAKRDALTPEVIEAELAAAAAADEKLKAERSDIDRQLNEINGALEMAGSEGRKGKLDDARIAEAAARRKFDRIRRRARSVNLLKAVIDRHRDDTKKRYAEPFRNELERLSKPVFGDNCRLEVDPDLSIVSRTVDGVTVPYELLSGGAKEQLGILVRLAGAALVADHETVPVVIDDALGFADPDRLDAMRKVLGDLGGEGQVIVLTCTPDRYVGIDSAQFIELG